MFCWKVGYSQLFDHSSNYIKDYARKVEWVNSTLEQSKFPYNISRDRAWNTKKTSYCNIIYHSLPWCNMPNISERIGSYIATLKTVELIFRCVSLFCFLYKMMNHILMKTFMIGMKSQLNWEHADWHRYRNVRRRIQGYCTPSFLLSLTYSSTYNGRLNRFIIISRGFNIG